MYREEELRKSLGRTVRAFRYRAGYSSQEAFARAATLHPTYVGGVERGERNPSLRSLLRIADALEMPLSRLVAEAEEDADRWSGNPSTRGPRAHGPD